MIIFSPASSNGDVTVYAHPYGMIGTLTHEQTPGGSKASEFKWLQLVRPNREMLSAEDLRVILSKLESMNVI